MNTLTLYAWFHTRDYPAVVIERPQGPLFIVQTQVGAEHFFAVVDGDTGAVAFFTVAQLLEAYGANRPVTPITVAGYYPPKHPSAGA